MEAHGCTLSKFVSVSAILYRAGEEAKKLSSKTAEGNGAHCPLQIEPSRLLAGAEGVPINHPLFLRR